MSPRTLSIILPAVFTVSLGLGYGFAPRAKQSAAAPSPAPTPPLREASKPAAPTPEFAAPAEASVESAEKSAGTVDDVFNALGTFIYCERAYRLEEAIGRLDAAQLQSVLEQIDSVGRLDQHYIVPRVIDRLMDLDPQQGLNWLAANAATFRDGSATYTVAFDMAYKKDPEGALRVYDSVPDGERRNLLGEIITRHLAMKDPEAARAFLQKFPQGPARDKLELGYVKGLAASNPTAAIAEALKWKQGTNRRASLAAAFLTLARAGQGQALAAMDQIEDGRERAEILGRLASRARQNEVPALAAFYETAVRNNPEFANWFNGLDRLAEGFARTNPTKAIEWAKSLPDKQREEALSSALNIWGWYQPEAAMAWVRENVSDTDEQQENLVSIYRDWTKTNPSKARAWAEKLPPGAERDRSMGLIVSQLATKGQHTEALDLLERLPDEQRGDLAKEVADSLVSENPSAASRWLANIEPDKDSASLFGRVASEWAEKDFKAAANWLGTIPAGECRDCAVSSYSHRVANLDLAVAADWAATVSNQHQRGIVLSGIISKWREQDARASERWLEATTALSADEKATLKEARQ
jgi:hypothetical protein